MRNTPLPAATERAATAIVDACLVVHRALGPGLLESAYEDALTIELRQRGHRVERQVTIQASFRGVPIDSVYRLDLVVDGCVVVELKSVERLAPIHTAQVLTYLRLSGHRLGLLVNFNTALIRDGLRRVIR